MKKKIVAVTGANQGLGFALIKMLCQKLGDEGLVYLTARNETKGLKAVEELQEQGLHPQFHVLDIDYPESVLKFRDYLKEKYGGVDIFIHNAAARQSPDKTPKDAIEPFIRTNNFGTFRVLENFVPLLNDKAHFLLIASSFGALKHVKPALHAEFDTDTLNLEQIKTALLKYVEHVKNGTDVEAGYPNWMNVISKIGQVAALRIVARDKKEEAKARGIMFNSICPGLLDTAASRPWFKNMDHAIQPEEATDPIWWVIEQDWNEKMYGELYRNKKELPWKME